MVLLSPVLSADDLPDAELRAARLDGELFELGGAWCQLGELEGPAHRARAALAGRSARLIADLGTAAWIWSAAPLPPTPTFAVLPDARARVSPAGNARVREAVLAAEDVVDVSGAGHRATSPLRTLVDLARSDEGVERETASRLLAIGGLGLDDALALLHARPGIPSKKTAADRLRALL